MKGRQLPNIVAIVPARGGSVRFPGKNVTLLAGKPLVAYPVEAALSVPEISRVIVSTDCGEIARVAVNFGAEVPFIRPRSLAGAESKVVDTIIHAVDWLEKNEKMHVDYTVLLQPTTPVLSSAHIKSAVDILQSRQKVDSVVTVTKVDTTSNPYNIRVRGKSGFMEFWQPEAHYDKSLREQSVFYKAANMWITAYETLINEGKLEGVRNHFLEVEWEYAMDIDYPGDLQLVEAWLEYKKSKLKAF